LRLARLALPLAEEDSGRFGAFREEDEEQEKEQSFTPINTHDELAFSFETDESVKYLPPSNTRPGA
jgi:hypothetical protein